jgi:hypothetical protein
MEVTRSSTCQAIIDRGGRFARTLLALETLLTVGAVGGGTALMSNPSSAMPAGLLAGTPLQSWFWPGVALVLLIAVPAAAVAVGTITGREYAHTGHVLVGAALVGWIVVQLMVLGPISVLQPVCLVWGLALTGLGLANHRAQETR